MLSTESNNGMVMPVTPFGGYGGCGNGFDWGWIILLLLIAGNGWGGFGGFGGYGGLADGAILYPWMNQADITTSGFQNAATNQAIGNLQNSVTSGFGDVQTALCGGFAGVNANISNGFAQAEIAENSRQMANMQQMFGIQSSLQNCCCENRANIADLKYTVASEECATRANSTQNTQSILNMVNSGIQSIKDQLCADKLDAKNDEIAQLRQEVLFARGQASQIAQNSTIIDGIYNRLDTCPVGTTPVYGRTPIFSCNNNSCGCGCGNF